MKILDTYGHNIYVEPVCSDKWKEAGLRGSASQSQSQEKRLVLALPPLFTAESCLLLCLSLSPEVTTSQQAAVRRLPLCHYPKQ